MGTQGEVYEHRIWANVDNEAVEFDAQDFDEVAFAVDPITSTAVYEVVYSLNGETWIPYSTPVAIGPSTYHTDRLEVLGRKYRVRVTTPEGADVWPRVYMTGYRPWAGRL